MFAQQILDEMQLVDISKEQAIRSTVIRDPAQALLVVKTQISSLRIQSNNIINKAEQVGPGTWHILLVPGTHRLSFQAEGFISVQERFYFNSKDVKGIRIRVVPAAEKKEEKNTGIVVIKSTPDSAAVYFNDQFYGVTPYLGKTLAGQYKLELKKEPFLSHRETVIIVSGETLPINVRLSSSSGSVEVSSNPVSARVEIDDRYIGQTPIVFTQLTKGMHKIKVTLENHEPFNSKFETSEKNRSQKFNISLIPQESSLTILGIPAKANVYIDGNETGFLPLENQKILYGSHHVSVTKPGFYSYDENILINKREPYTLDIKLAVKSKQSALLYSALLPGSGQFYSGRTTQAIIVGAATLGAAVTTVLFYNNYLDKKDTYSANKNAYDTNTDLGKMQSLYNTMQDSYGEMDSADSRVKFMFFLTAVIWIYNVVDAYMFFPELSELDLTADTQAQQTSLRLSIKF
jgi:TM2 domain-containing membrane protein YozV